jgi:hypothetical protein
MSESEADVFVLGISSTIKPLPVQTKNNWDVSVYIVP